MSFVLIDTTFSEYSTRSMRANANPRLDGISVHIWTINLPNQRPAQNAHYASLSREEKAHVARLSTSSLRDAYIASHGAMRCILSSYVSMRPCELTFQNGTYAKPALCGQAQNLRFNLSHSKDLAILGVSLQSEVGVDVESVRPFAELRSVVDMQFTPAEKMELASLDGPKLVEAFYACWTRKEALLKSLGVGLNAPLDAIEVSADPLVQHWLTRAPCYGNPGMWRTFSFKPKAGYVAAAAALQCSCT